MTSDSKRVGGNLLRKMMCNWEICWCLDMKEIWNLKFVSLIQLIVIENMQSICRKNEEVDFAFLRKFRRNLNSKCLPQRFTYANGLINKKCDLIIRDERQRSWKLKLSSCKTRTYIIGGWHKLSADNCLKTGDRIMFEVVTNGETPVWKFRVVTNQETPLQNFQDIMKKPSSMSLLDAQVATSTSGDDDHPYFISTLKPYSFSKPNLYFPMDFAKSNGWMNRKCEMILKDEAERCWSVWIGRMGHNFGITRGWTNFRVEKGFQVGDAYKFELIKNGKVPIAYFHCKYSG
ncbi:hypothetical protein P3S68_002554 [Capsicum galapagoense]